MAETLNRVFVIWDWQNGRELQRLRVPFEQSFTGAAFSADGKTVATKAAVSEFGRGEVAAIVQLWDLPSLAPRLAKPIQTRAVREMLFSHDGSTLVIGTEDGQIGLWNTKTGEQITTLAGRPQGIDILRYSPDGSQLVSAGMTSIKWWKTSMRSGPARIHTSVENPNMAFLSNGHLAVWRSSGNQLSNQSVVIDAASNQIDSKFKLPGVLLSARSGLDTCCVLCSLPGHVGSGIIVNTRTNAETPVRLGKDEVLFAISNHGGWLAARQNNQTRIHSVSKSTDIVVRHDFRFPPPLVFSPNGRLVIQDLAARSATIADTATGDQIHRIDHPIYALVPPVFSDDGRKFVFASLEPEPAFCVWDLERGELARKFATLCGDVQQLALSPDSRRIVAATTKGGQTPEIRIWDTNSGLELLRLVGTEGEIFVLAFSPDGLRLAAANQAGNVWIWEANASTAN